MHVDHFEARDKIIYNGKFCLLHILVQSWRKYTLFQHSSSDSLDGYILINCNQEKEHTNSRTKVFTYLGVMTSI